MPQKTAPFKIMMINHSVMKFNLADSAYLQLSININNKFWFATKDVNFVCNFKSFDHIKYHVCENHA